jgi:hypothetical protein
MVSFLTSALSGSEWLTSCPGYFTPGKECRYPLNRRLGGPQSQSGCFEEEKNLLPVLGCEPRTVQHIALSLYLLHYSDFFSYEETLHYIIPLLQI